MEATQSQKPDQPDLRQDLPFFDEAANVSKERLERLYIVFLDVVLLNVAFLLYKVFREKIPIIGFTEQASELIAPMIFVTFFWGAIFSLFGLYRTWNFGSRYEEVVTVIQAITAGTLLIFVLIFADDMLIEDPEGILRPHSPRFGAFVYWALLVALLPLGRVIERTLRRRRLISGERRRRGIIIGMGTRAMRLAADIKRHPALGVDIVGFIEDSSAQSSFSSTTSRTMAVESASSHHHPAPHHLSDTFLDNALDLPHIGHIDALDSIVVRYRIKEIFIATEQTEHHELVRIIGRCEGKNVGLKVLPDMYDIIAGTVRSTQLYGTPLLDLTPPLLTPLQENLKRLTDIAAALTVLILGAPIWLLMIGLVRRDTRASAFYTQERIGLHGKPFMIYKFRTMRADAEKDGPKLTTKDDPRITPLGRVLRKFRIDEFPQFWNVLRGDMSLVGPRPERAHFIKMISEHAPQYARLHRVRPGITSWGQVKYGYAESVDEMIERLKYDLYYLENMSLKMDLKIVLATIYVVVAGRGQ